MPFEFDPTKSAANKDKHGISFEEAQALWGDESRIENDARFDGEARHLVTGWIGDHLWTAIFTLRQDNVRLISVRRARDEEIQRCEDNNS
jgi:uncharacterized protein